MTVTSEPAPTSGWIPRDLYPFESRFAPIGEHRVHHIDEGTGPPLLLLHGNPTWSFLYRDIVRALRHRSRCIAVDYPGFGRSRAGAGYDYLPESHARAMAGFVSHLGLDGFSPMVQDWGGPIGFSVAEQHAPAVRALVIGNTWAWPVNGDPHFERFSKLMGGAVGKTRPTRSPALSHRGGTTEGSAADAGAAPWLHQERPRLDQDA